MQVTEFALYVSVLGYGLLYAPQLLYIYFSVIAVYLVFASFVKNSKYMTLRKKIMIGSWNEPSEGLILANLTLDCTKVLAHLNKLPKEQRPTLTHVIIKMQAYIMKQCPDINGLIRFGKFVEFDRVNISCLVDVNNGEDLASVLVEDADQKTVGEIRNFIAEKASKIKAKKDAIHKQQVGTFQNLPSFLVPIIASIANFLANTLGLDIPPLQLKKYPFGGCLITAIGAIGMKNAFAPFNKITKAPVIIAINAIQKVPMVVNDKIEIREVVNLNYEIDHRFMDGARAIVFNKIIKGFFDEPEKYLDLSK